MLGEEALDSVAVSPGEIERGADRDRVEALADRVRTALRQTLDGLAAQDRLIMRMLFEEGLTVAQVAGILKLDQKPLYRHRDLLFATMRRRLEVAGITAGDVNDLWQRDGGQHD
jgi:DNA-directed RNA polymerase specialized sigma24 family protein